MKLLPSLTSALLLTAISLQAQTLFSENFNFDISASAKLSDNGWNAYSGGGTNPITINGSGAVPLSGAGEDDAKNFLQSYALTDGDRVVTTMNATFSSVTAIGDYFSMLKPSDSETTLFYQRLYAKSDGNGGVQLGLSIQSTTPATQANATIDYGTSALSLNQPHTLSIQYNVIAGAANDYIALFVDGLSYLIKNFDGTTLGEPTIFGAFTLRQGGTSTAPSLVVDDISVVVVPEPSTMVALTLGAGLLVFSRRRSGLA